MLRKIDSTTVTRVTIWSLIVALALVLSGCAGLRMDTGSDLDPLVTGGYQGNETLAVLLPRSGRFAGPAKVIRNGIVAANKADPQGKRPKLRFYDSTAGSITALVRKAAAEGAGLAIGPLQKPAVTRLMDSSDLPIPVLALNQVTTTGTSPHLYQFSLAPEGEAIEVANQAWKQQHRKAVALYPENAWGNRIFPAFRQRWQALGGTLVGVRTFNPAAKGFSDTVKKLSEQAGEADFVFLVAPSKQARRIWPGLRNKLGTRVPVYATSHIYGGRFDPKGDRDLRGLRFVEIPWLIESIPDDQVAADGLSGKLPRLYAMGVDAYRLGARLDWMRANPHRRLQGKTGILKMDTRRQIRRELTLARIDADGPVKLVPSGQVKQKRLPWLKSLFF